jgi:phosphoribosylformylglycinamidine (FGAM) synthase-like amidotransferase family enzyme
VPSYLAKHYFWMCLCRCFQMRLTSKLVDYVKKMVFLNMNEYHKSLENWIKQKVEKERNHPFFCLYKTGKIYLS